MKMKVENHPFYFKKPFVITGYTFTVANTVKIILEDNGYIGCGEAIGIFYEGETSKKIMAQLDAIADKIVSGISSEDIQELLPLGGARTALDCALWDLKAKKAKKSIWQFLNITPKPLTTVATVSIKSPKDMAQEAKELSKYTNLKIKLNNDNPIAALEAIRAARPDATLIVDVNQGWNFEELKEYIAPAQKLGIKMIEQPLPRGGDEALEGFKSAVPLGADESCLDSSEYETAARRYDVINIKLDKCGGLTDALKIIKLATKDKKELMVGNMCGTSLSMAPAYIVGQYCKFVDLDGPLFLKTDVNHGLEYMDGGVVSLPTPELWD